MEPIQKVGFFIYVNDLLQGYVTALSDIDALETWLDERSVLKSWGVPDDDGTVLAYCYGTPLTIRATRVRQDDMR
jgi:hypothetical protein